MTPLFAGRHSFTSWQCVLYFTHWERRCIHQRWLALFPCIPTFRRFTNVLETASLLQSMQACNVRSTGNDRRPKSPSIPLWITELTQRQFQASDPASLTFWCTAHIYDRSRAPSGVHKTRFCSIVCNFVSPCYTVLLCRHCAKEICLFVSGIAARKDAAARYRSAVRCENITCSLFSIRVHTCTLSLQVHCSQDNNSSKSWSIPK